MRIFALALTNAGNAVPQIAPFGS